MNANQKIRNEVFCPTCDASVGKHCRSISDLHSNRTVVREIYYVHVTRLSAYKRNHNPFTASRTEAGK